MATPTLLDMGRRLLAIAKTGLYYTENAFERERYEEVVKIAGELLSMNSAVQTDAILQAWKLEDGYVTPKLDVRGADNVPDNRATVHHARRVRRCERVAVAVRAQGDPTGVRISR